MFLNLFVCFYCKSQQTATNTVSGRPGISYDSSCKSNIAFRPSDVNLNVNRSGNTSVKTVPSTFYFNSIGFFCQKELQVEKALKFAVKFRLGSVDYTNEMEGKGKGRH